jgi:hypothetical protein
VTTFDPLLNHMGVFVKIGDEVAKVWFIFRHSRGPYLTWSADTFLCEFCLTGSFCGIEGKVKCRFVLIIHKYISQ